MSSPLAAAMYALLAVQAPAVSPPPAATPAEAPPVSGKAKAAAPAAGNDVVHLRNGDRITGKLLAETARTLRLQTAFGRLNIPRARVAKLVRADGREETFPAWDTPRPSPAPEPPAQPALALAITGKTFWYAWDRREAPSNPALRLQVEVDDAIVAAYDDARTDPEDIRNAVVNAFSFPDVTLERGDGASVLAPEVAPGRIGLRVGLPRALAGPRRVRVSYQVAGADGAWQRVATAEAEVDVAAAGDTPIEVRQDMGRMEYSRRKMKNVETFRLEVVPPPAPSRDAA
jgi:hypothetical protein